VYSPEGYVNILGTNTNHVIDKFLRRQDKTKSQLRHVEWMFRHKKETMAHLYGNETGALVMKKVQSRQCLEEISVRAMRQKLRNKLWQAKMRYRAAELKTRNVVKDMHYKAAHLLLSRFQTLILPHTTSHHWRRGKRLSKRVKRRIQALSFGKFASRVLETATWYPESRIVRGSEAYTSKQCGRCGVLNDELGASEIFWCNECGFEADRDVHAARNILLRFLAP
jgi:hypothetical protein